MNTEIFVERRKRFLQALSDGIAILFAAPSVTRNDDNHYPYRTCSYFYYLTGVEEAGAAAIFNPHSSEPFQLFVQPKNAVAEMWGGRRYGVELAKTRFRADSCFPVEQWEEKLKEALKQTTALHFLLGLQPETEKRVLEIVRTHVPNIRGGDKAFSGIKKAQAILDPMRVVKDEAEIELMRKNSKNSALAHRKAMEFTKVGLSEYQVQAELEYWFRTLGAEDLAYPSIVASGENALVLHYVSNRDRLKDGDLLLIDAGGELGLYASDITRTFPVNGKFTPAQRKLYELVLESQRAAFAAIKVGARFHDVHDAALKVLVEGLIALKFISGPLEEALKDKTKYGPFFPHGTSHWLGLDVHDAGAYHDGANSSIPLVAGNILTVEPGIYIPTDRADIPAEYRGIGIRIEDDVLVTAEGYEVLTLGAPKEIAELEAIVGTGTRKP